MAYREETYVIDPEVDTEKQIVQKPMESVPVNNLKREYEIIEEEVDSPTDQMLQEIHDTAVAEGLVKEDEGLIVPSFSVIIRGIRAPYDPYFIMAFLSSKRAWAQIERSRSGRVLSIISNESVSELEIPSFSEEEMKDISTRFRRYLEFRRLSSEIIELEKERNDTLFLGKEE